MPRRHFRIPLFSILAVLSVAWRAQAFDGCNVTGTWQTTSSTLSGIANLRESAGGSLTGSFLNDDAFTDQGTIPSGTRVADVITYDVVLSNGGGPFSFSGTMPSCDTFSGTIDVNGTPLAFSGVRVSASYCGDGTTDPGEDCDDGNFANDDSCSIACEPPVCGNHVLEGTEECDDGNTANGDGCSNICTITACGNGVIEPGEQCDDDNLVNGDGCSKKCLVNVCGNGTIEDGEQCDDGNTANGDGCSSLCQFEGCDITGKWQSSFGISNLRESPGGSFVGSYLNNDAFTDQGTISAGTRVGNAVTFNFTPSTGGGTFSFSGTLSDCDTLSGTITISGSQLPLSSVRVSDSYCGDGTTDPGESCDDGNFSNADSCSIACQAAACGNRVVEGAEECDDGNLVNGDGCSNICTITACGNGVIEPGEQCDDDNLVNGDGCSQNCLVNVCGNGTIEDGEQCDDGNTANGDGCSSLCQFEGCDITGNWQAGLLGPVNLREQAGAITGTYVSTTPQRDAGTITSGSRVHSTLAWTFTNSTGTAFSFAGSMSGCDAFSGNVSLGGSQLLVVNATRVRTTYCGDGTRQADEQCDDGDFIDTDSCTADCRLPHCGNSVVDALEQCDDGNAIDTDACKNDCSINTCGDGVVRAGVEQCDLGGANSNAPDAACRLDCTPRRCGDGVTDSTAGEQCDDGNVTASDGCDGLCQTELSAGTTVPPNPPAPVTVTTDPGGAGATPTAPVQAAVTTSVPGDVSIVVTSVTVPPQSGFELLGKQVNITASPGTAQAPLIFAFTVDASLVPAGGAAALTPFRNQVPVPDCLGATQALPNDPCLTARTTLGSGDVALTILTSQASQWNVGIKLTFDAAQQACRKQVRKLLAGLAKSRLSILQKCIGAVSSGKNPGPCPDAKAATALAKAAAKVSAAAIASKCPDVVIASLGARGACAGASGATQLAACVVSETTDRTALLLDSEYADATAALPDKTVQKCQATIADKSGKYAVARLQALGTCQGKQDEGTVSSCLDPAAAAKLGKTRDKLAPTIGAKCATSSVTALTNLGFGGSCSSAATVSGIVSCEVNDHDAQTDALGTLLP